MQTNNGGEDGCVYTRTPAAADDPEKPEKGRGGEKVRRHSSLTMMRSGWVSDK